MDLQIASISHYNIFLDSYGNIIKILENIIYHLKTDLTLQEEKWQEIPYLLLSFPQ